ncbi:hypothetical protein DYB28_001997, partial [Aphanomyces astaci]
SLDNRVIFRYLTVQKILEKHSAAMSPDFAVFVEMAASSTMKVMDTTLTKRLTSVAAHLHSFPRPPRGSPLSPSDNRPVVERMSIFLDSYVDRRDINI